MPDVPERARLRLREEMARRRLSQRDIAGLLNWSQSRVAKLLSGRVQMSLSDLEWLASALSISPVEIIRDRGLEFCAELTPTELRLLERIRELPVPVLEAVKTLIQISPASIERRGVTPRKKLFGTPRK